MFDIHRVLVAGALLATVTTNLLAAAQSTSCSNATFAISLRNCTFESAVTSWGNLVEVGSPPQRLCLVPSTVINSTLVSQESLCDVSKTFEPHKCEALRGGFFNENSSTTWTDVALSSYNDTRSNPTWEHFNPPGFTKVGYDRIVFPNTDNNVALYGAGIALNQYGNNSNAGMIGLGKDSVFLNDAVRQARSGSKSWSLDAGSNSFDKPRNGELVIGGYNAARTDGSFSWTNVSNMAGDRPCPLRTKITDMSITLGNGTIVPIKSNAEIVEACIEPYDNLFRFTSGMLFTWKDITEFNSTLMEVYTSETANNNLSFTELGLPYDSSRVGNWQLSITLDSGYKTTLPASELQRPLLGFDNLGNKQAVEGITNLQILDVPTGEGEVPTLGKIFLSRSYLAVNYETSQFGLALALAATDNPPPNKYISFPSALCTNTTSPSSTPPSSSSPKPLGAIIGGSIGGFILLLILVLAIYLFRRRRRRRRNEAAAAAAAQQASPHYPPNVDPYMVAQGLGGQQQISEVYSEPHLELYSDSHLDSPVWVGTGAKSPNSGGGPGRNNSFGGTTAAGGGGGSQFGDASPRTPYSDVGTPGGGCAQGGQGQGAWMVGGVGRPLYEVPG